VPDVRLEDDGVEQVPTRRTQDLRTSAGGRFDQALLFQELDRFSDHGSRDAEFRAQLRLGRQEGIAWIDPRDDAVDEMSDHRRAQSATTARSDRPKRASQADFGQRDRRRGGHGASKGVRDQSLPLRICNSYDEVSRVTW
jgi:hypothetical protein